MALVSASEEPAEWESGNVEGLPRGSRQIGTVRTSTTTSTAALAGL